MKCLECKEELEGYEPQFCCNGRECGCMGLPIDPPLCDKCWEKVMGKGELMEWNWQLK